MPWVFQIVADKICAYPLHLLKPRSTSIIAQFAPNPPQRPAVVDPGSG